SGEIKAISFPYSSGSIQITIGTGATPVNFSTYMSSAPVNGGTTQLVYRAVTYTAGGGQSAFWSRTTEAPLSAPMYKTHNGGNGSSGGGAGLWVRYVMNDSVDVSTWRESNLASWTPAQAVNQSGAGYIPPPAISVSSNASGPGASGQIGDFGALGGGGGGGYTGNGGNPRHLGPSATAPFGLGGGAGGGAGAGFITGSSDVWFFTPYNWGTVYPAGLGVGQGFGGQPGRDAAAVSSSVLSGGIQMVAPCDAAIRAPAPATDLVFSAWNVSDAAWLGSDQMTNLWWSTYRLFGSIDNPAVVTDPSPGVLANAEFRASGYGAGGNGGGAFKVRIRTTSGSPQRRLDTFQFSRPGAGANGVVLLRYHKTP
ncbi:MAG TPA: hypothetical protein VN259_09115, partial [Xanthomonadales bacterium]|nr:hypothetical protein [Xanthomonadales bacterium]